MKKLIMLLAAISLLAMPAYAAVQNVKIGGDLTMLGLLRNNFDLKDEQRENLGAGVNPNTYQDEREYLASIIRVRLDADLTENITTTLRLINERDWDGESTTSTDIDLDLAYVVLKEFMMSPTAITVGRQELHFGNDLIIGDPTRTTSLSGTSFEAADLSLRKGFDAVRLSYDLSDYAPATIDAFYAKVDENTTTLNDDVNLYGVNVGYTVEDANALVETYYFGKSSGSSTGNSAANSHKTENIHNLGARGSIDPMEDLNVQVEGTYQFGDFAGGTLGTIKHVPGDRSAWATQAIVKYSLPVLTEYSPVLKAAYLYLSGEEEADSADGDWHLWDPMYENQNPGNIMNALFEYAGIQAVTLTGSLKPIEDLTLTWNNVYAWFTTEFVGQTGIVTGSSTAESKFTTATYANTLYVTNNKALGWESDVELTYDYTEDVKLGLTTGIFFPGAAFDTVANQAQDYEKGNNDTAWEAIASMKVIF